MICLKIVGRILQANKISQATTEKSCNPLWNVQIYQDELESLLNGELPVDWSDNAD